MTTAQVVFSIALAVITAVTVAFAVYVFATSVWANRWVGRGNRARRASRVDAS